MLKKIVAKLFLTFFFLIPFSLISSPFLEAQEEIIEITTEGYKYAVKLPTGYQDYKKYPVLFCFHNKGDGVEAVRIFGYASYHLNWIIVGIMDLSYSHLNQEAWKDIILTQESILKDVEEKYSIKKERHFAAGFSQGASMALTLAYAHPEKFEGVLACSGNFGLGEPVHSVAVYWCAGSNDHALNDIKDSYDRLDYMDIKSTLHIFEGRHQWPSTEVINAGLYWLHRVSLLSK